MSLVHTAGGGGWDGFGARGGRGGGRGHPGSRSFLGKHQTREMDMKFSYLTGVVDAESRTRFERQIFRMTRGNCYVRFSEIVQPLTDPVTGVSVMKLVFIVFFKVRWKTFSLHHGTKGEVGGSGVGTRAVDVTTVV